MGGADRHGDRDEARRRQVGHHRPEQPARGRGPGRHWHERSREPGQADRGHADPRARRAHRGLRAHGTASAAVPARGPAGRAGDGAGGRHRPAAGQPALDDARARPAELRELAGHQRRGPGRGHGCAGRRDLDARGDAGRHGLDRPADRRKHLHRADHQGRPARESRSRRVDRRDRRGGDGAPADRPVARRRRQDLPAEAPAVRRGRAARRDRGALHPDPQQPPRGRWDQRPGQSGHGEGDRLGGHQAAARGLGLGHAERRAARRGLAPPRHGAEPRPGCAWRRWRASGPGARP